MSRRIRSSSARLTLAYIGDGVYELFVREYIVSKGNCPVKKLHARAVEMVRCEFQAENAHRAAPAAPDRDGSGDLPARPQRARFPYVPKNSSVADYHKRDGRSSACSATCTFPARLDRLRFFFDTIAETAQAGG